MIKNKEGAINYTSINEILSRNTRDNTLSVPVGASSISTNGYTITSPSSVLTNTYTITSPSSISTNTYTIPAIPSDNMDTDTATAITRRVRDPMLMEKEYTQLAVKILSMIVTRRQQIDQDDFKKQDPFKYRDLINEIDNDEFYLLNMIEAYVNDEDLPNDVKTHLETLEQKYM